jgi:hypothetical protein
MKRLLSSTAERLAPRTVNNLRKLNNLEDEFDSSDLSRLISYERELRELRREVDELRRDNRRVAELYDVFFQWAHQNASGPPNAAPSTNYSATVDRVADLLAEDRQGSTPSSEAPPTTRRSGGS